MASTKLNSWGVALLLAATTVGCSSGTANQGGGSCPDPATQRACPINGVAMCTNVLTDATNCGACGTVCSGMTGLCSNGVCTGSCQSGQTQCGSSCTNTSNDINNCGSCNTKCNSGSSCVNGSCQTSSSSVGGQGNTTATSQGGNNPGNGGNSSSSTTNQGGSSTSSNTSQGGNTSTTSSGQGGATSAGGSSAKGGASTGGSSTSTSAGGTSSSSVGGSSAKGGASSGGSGTTATGGTSTSSSAGGTTSTGDRPPGYFYTKDWNVTSADWHGCVWTGIDTVASTTTTISTPSTKDFLTVANGGPYRVAGTVHNTYESVAMIGFNLNEATTGDNKLCAYDAAAATAAGPPAATIPSSATGIAINFSMAKAPPTSFRVQIQMADGATNADHRWCATITSSGGKTFVPFTDFLTQCWNAGKTGTGKDGPGNKYNNEAIDAVVFLVPGTTAQKADFDYTIIGFAPGTSKDDAPGGTAACGTATGTVGSTTASQDASMQRKLVNGTDCKDYIIFNNNWGQPTSSTQVVDFVGNSLTVKSSTASVSGQGVPGSFPSIYVGANGDIAGGTYNTWANTGLPKKISAISSAKTTFTWSGGSSGGDFNAAYDVWFNKATPTAGGYNDAISGFIMVWLYKPTSRSPIGSVKRQATIAGQSWDVWVGPRGNTSTGTDDANRPVVSYVAKSTLQTLTFDLKDFMNDAVTNAAADKSAGSTSQAFSNDWYLTDVFAGFEVWSGGAATGLKETFSIDIK